MTYCLDQGTTVWAESTIHAIHKCLIEGGLLSLIFEFSSILIPLILVGFIYRQVKLQIYNIDHQTKVASANLLWNFISRLQANDFRAANKYIKNNNSRRGSVEWHVDSIVHSEKYSILVPRFLNHFDRMAIFEKDGVVTIKQIQEMFGAYLRNIRDSKEAMKLIDERQEDYSEDFKPLQRLLKKID